MQGCTRAVDEGFRQFSDRRSIASDELEECFLFSHFGEQLVKKHTFLTLIAMGKKLDVSFRQPHIVPGKPKIA
jgi:hypothetical protein